MSEIEWQPVETAPKDGREIRVRCKNTGVWWTAKWNPGGDSWVDKDGGFNGQPHHLAVTGVWDVDEANSWLEPPEVDVWMPKDATP